MTHGSGLGFWATIAADLTGRGKIRLIVQPLIGLIFGIRMGREDARLGHEPFLLRLARGADNRRALLGEALRQVLLPFAVAVGLDALLQALTLHRVRPLAAVVVGLLLVFVPYAVARALAGRWARRASTRRPGPSGAPGGAVQPSR